MKSRDIVYEGKKHWVLKVNDGFEVYKIGITHSARCSQIGTIGSEGLKRAIKDCNERDKKD